MTSGSKFQSFERRILFIKQLKKTEKYNAILVP